MKQIVLLLAFLQIGFANAQTAWPSPQSWSTATPLTSLMGTSGITELSGLHWNPVTNRLYCVQDDGRLRVLQLNTVTNTFTQIANRTVSGGPEGITQTDYSANGFYTMDENNYQIKQYTNTASFSSVTLTHSWNLLIAPSPMEDTGNTGPEGIVFVPDASLAAINFTSSVTGQPYTSVKGAGGLFFIAHQDGGYIWVFDLNPNLSNDFAYVGKYKTHRTESCDLAFDRTTGLLYILHNVGNNYLEVTDMTLAAGASEPTFTKTAEHFLSNPTDGDVNIEGFALMPKCGDLTGSAWLCRDVESSEDDAIQQDVLRWFNPFTADGTCTLSAATFAKNESLKIFPNPGNNQMTISIEGNVDFSVDFVNVLGQTVLKKNNANGNTFDVSRLEKGIYMIEVKTAESTSTTKWIKN